MNDNLEHIASMERDAQRYRWLRDKHNNHEETLCVLDDDGLLEDRYGFPENSLDLDAAIDAAMNGANA